MANGEGRRFRNRRDWERNEEYAEGVDFEYTVEYDPETPTPRVVVERDPLLYWAEKTGIDKEVWESLGVKPLQDRFIVFTWPQGWTKKRDVTMRVDAVTKDNKRVNRFRWMNPPPGGVHPLWPYPEEEKQHPEIWLCEGESDCVVLRTLGFDAYTYGAATNIPSDVELRHLDFMGVERVILVYDADRPGRENTAKVAEAISSHGETGEEESARHIDVIPLNLDPVLKRWTYLKDIRDLYNKLHADELKSLLESLREGLLASREEDISSKSFFESAKEPYWIWDGLAAGGALLMLYGPPKVGKTTLTYHEIKAMGGADGTGKDGRDNGLTLLTRTIKPQRVLYYSEMPASFDKAAQRAICGGPLDNLWIRSSTDKALEGLTWPQIVMQVERDVAKYKIDFVIIDTVIEWFKFESEEMYDPAVVGGKLRMLRRLTAKGVTVQVNHHPPKAGGSPFGSVVFQGYVDCLVDMERDSKGTTLHAVGRLRSDFSSVKYGFADKNGTALSVIGLEDREDREGQSSVGELAGAKGRILALLPYHPGTMSVKDLLTDELLAKGGLKSLRARLAELMKADLVGKDEDMEPVGYYRKFGIEVVKEEKGGGE